MDFNLDVRLKQLESLEQYISSSRDKVQSILDCLKWDAKEVMKDTQLIRCSVDRSHRVHLKSVDEHVKKCSLRKEGYDLNEEFLSEPVHGAASSIIIDDHKKIEILSAAHRSITDFKAAWNGQDPDPKTANRVTSTFSPYERAALHTYAVKNTTGPPQLPEFNTNRLTKSDDKPLTFEELRLRERDAKRRRIKYKSVHTNRKSHKEVMREVIDGQMEMYTDWLADNGLVKTEQKCENRNVMSPKIEHDESYEEHQKTGRCSVTDFNKRDHSVSRNSTHSGSSRSRSTSVRKPNRDRYDYKHHKQRDDCDYKRRHSNSYKGRRSKEQHAHRKHERSHSRHDYNGRRHYDSYKER